MRMLYKCSAVSLLLLSFHNTSLIPLEARAQSELSVSKRKKREAKRAVERQSIVQQAYTKEYKRKSTRTPNPASIKHPTS